MLISLMPPRRVVAAVAAVGAMTLAASPAVLAHDAVIGGNPADGEVMEEFPRAIELEFSGLPRRVSAPWRSPIKIPGASCSVVSQASRADWCPSLCR